jgi:hypothetical protein
LNSNSNAMSRPSPPRRNKVKVTPQILEQCLFGTADLTAEERSSRYAFSDSYAGLAGDDANASRPSGGGANQKIDDMLESDTNTTTCPSDDVGTAITYQRPDGAQLAVPTPLAGSSAGSNRDGGASGHAGLSDTLNSGQHHSLTDESNLLGESNAELTQSLMDLGLGGDTSASSPPKDEAVAKECKRESPARLDAWIEGEEEDNSNDGGGGDDANPISYTKPDGQVVDLVMPLKIKEGTSSSPTHYHHHRGSKSSHEVNDMSTSMRGRLMQAAAADEAEHATG